jgi:hypothetical protein
MAARKENERPITAQGLVNQIMPAIIIAALLWVGGKVDKSGEGLTSAQVELTFVKESLKGLNDDQTKIMAAVGDMGVLRERMLQNNERMNQLSERVTALEKLLRELEVKSNR